MRRNYDRLAIIGLVIALIVLVVETSCNGPVPTGITDVDQAREGRR